MMYLYVLKLSNGDLYKGITSDLKRRYNEHKLGIVKSTKGFHPLKLIHYECYLLESDCVRREKFLKTTEGGRLLKQQLRDVINM